LRRRGVCSFCEEKKEPDYKQVEQLHKFITDRAKIVGRGRSGLCQKHQRRVATAVKRARYLGLLPFVVQPRYS
jgi:small subunit ribosomal protein S18